MKNPWKYLLKNDKNEDTFVPIQIIGKPVVEKIKFKLNYMTIGSLLVLLLLSNLLVMLFFYQKNIADNKNNRQQLYLISQAKKYVFNVDEFEEKVRKVSRRLRIPPEWLMAVMHSESRFDASVVNHKGSGATGLIQWMPNTAKEFNLTTEKLRNMNHIQQLDYVYQYLDQKRRRHKPYQSLTDLYLAILYPRAIGENPCYTLYAKPSRAYIMNIGLDKNKDGRVTVYDIEQHLKQRYLTAYGVEKQASFARFLDFDLL